MKPDITDALPTRMNAAVFDSYGPPAVLDVADVPRPGPGRGEVLVKVLAASINGGELTKRSGKVKCVSGRRFPQPIGVDFVGIVAELGEDVTGLRVGARVWGTVHERSGTGTQAEYVAVPADRVGTAPSNLSATDAVTLIAGGTTALTALRDLARVQPGERVLVRGAAGGVGSVAVQVGAMLGAQVTGLAAPSSEGFVREMGAREVIDYRTPARELGTFDVIFDTRGSEARRYRSLLTGNGRMITITPDLARPVTNLAYLAFSAVHRAQRVRLFLGNPDARILHDVAMAAESGKLRPVLHRTFGLEDIVTAHETLERGGVQGKLVLTVAA
jgi:NADPH:quinone reductase-like Zn-dependent oxidoreductase